MKLLQLEHLDLEELQPSYDDLPQTGHKDSEFRKRRYSVIKPYPGNIQIVENSSFNQSSAYNKFQGDVDRKFEDVEQDVLSSQPMAKLLSMFLKSNDLDGGHRMDVHQMRIITGDYPYESVEVSPEGIHQDGYDYIAMIGVKRHNATGGHITVSREKDSVPFINMALEDGDMFMLNDKELWHSGTTLRAADPADIAYIDLFVFTAHHDGWDGSTKVKG